MWDELRDRITQLLMNERTGVLCALGTDEPSGIAVRYRSEGLELACLLPDWTDVAYAIEVRPQVVLLISLREGVWVRVHGLARLVTLPDWTGLLPDGHSITSADRYVVAHILPRRIDLLDEMHAWGVRETLELV